MGSDMTFWNIGGILFAIAIGALLPLQPLINARLGQLTHSVLFAAFVSFFIGTTTLATALLATRTALPTLRAMGSLPTWAWLGGGMIGALYVLGATVLIPRLGVASLVCLVVFGQMLASLVLDHYGVLHAPRPADALSVLGVMLVAVGVLLLVRPWQAS